MGAFQADDHLVRFLGAGPTAHLVLGGTFEVATLDGPQTRVKVTEGSQNGKQFRLKGKGMPVLRSSQCGDM